MNFVVEAISRLRLLSERVPIRLKVAEQILEFVTQTSNYVIWLEVNNFWVLQTR
jgi:hypothetical protein